MLIIFISVMGVLAGHALVNAGTYQPVFAGVIEGELIPVSQTQSLLNY